MTDDATTDQLPTAIAPADRLLTAAEFQKLADVPPEVEWFANISNHHTRRAYENAVKDFMRFAGIARPEEFRTVTRAHIVAWRDDLAHRGLGGSTIRPKASSGRGQKAAKAKRRRSAITRRASCWPRRRKTPSKASATGPSCPRCCSTRYGARNCASSRSGIVSTREKACRISGFPAKVARRVICHCIPAHMHSFTTILMSLDMALMRTAHCSVQFATTAPAGLNTRSQLTASTS